MRTHKKGKANHFIEEIGMKGMLELSDTELIFQTDKKNFRQYTLSLSLEEIVSVKIKNNLKIFPYGIVITTNNGKEHRFAVWHRKKWLHAIESARKQYT